MKVAVRLRQGDLGWLGLAAGVVAYELAADDGELLSEAVDRYLTHRPVLTTTVIAVTAAHLANLIRPAELDPFTLAFAALRRARRYACTQIRPRRGRQSSRGVADC